MLEIIRKPGSVHLAVTHCLESASGAVTLCVGESHIDSTSSSRTLLSTTTANKGLSVRSAEGWRRL